MKLSNVMKAYDSMQPFTVLLLPFSKARALQHICNSIKSDVDFYLHEERKLIDKFAKKDVSGNPLIKGNKIQFESIDLANKYLAEITKLNDLDIDVVYTSITLTETEIGDLYITEKDLEQIEGFITIE